MCGLVAALELARAGASVILLEKGNTPGGVITTHREGDWLLEYGPNSMSFIRDDETHQFLKELNLVDLVTCRPLREHDRYIWRGGRLRRVPVSPLQVLRKNALSRRSIIRAGLGSFRPHPKLSSDISIGAYFSPLVGRPVVEQVLAPALAGIYAADPFALSLEAVMPRLHEAARQSTSLIGTIRTMKKQTQKVSASSSTDRQPRVLASFHDGMTTVTERLAHEILSAGGEIETGFAAKSISPTEKRGWIVKSDAGREIEALRLVCALPAYAAAPLLADQAPDSAQALKRIYYAPMTVVHVGVREADVSVTLPGFGYLATRNNGVRSLGMIWSDRIFPGRAPEGHRLFTTFLGGQVDPLVNELPDTELLEAVFNDLRTVMKWRGSAPAFCKLTRHQHAIPLMEVGHPARIRAAIQHQPANFWLTGNYVAGVSLPACIKAGKSVAEEVMKTR